MAKENQFGAVTPDNMRGSRPTVRRDPDETTPPPAVQPEPEPQPGPAPTDPTPPPPPAAPQNAVASRGTPAGGGTLASVLTAPNHAPGQPATDSVTALAALAGMRRRPVDPMQDWTGDGTRKPRWLKAAVAQYAMLTGRNVQEVERDALLGIHPIPDDVLDANWLDCYGFPRSAYDPQAYR